MPMPPVAEIRYYFEGALRLARGAVSATPQDKGKKGKGKGSHGFIFLRPGR